MAELQQFEQLISALTDTDNTRRAAAEEAFKKLKTEQPGQVLLSLIRCVRGSKSSDIRSECVILMRSEFVRGKNPTWKIVPEEVRVVVKNELLLAMEAETENAVRHMIANSIAELGGLILADGQWNDLLPVMFRCSKSPNSGHRESALSIFSQLCEALGKKLHPFLHVLKEVIVENLSFENLAVKLEALRAVSSVLQALQVREERAMFQDLLPLMVEVISAALRLGKVVEARDALQVFVHLAENEASFLRPHVVPLAAAMFQLAGTPGVDTEVKHMALEFLITLAESRAGLVKKIPNFLSSLLPLLLQMLVQLDNLSLADWNKRDDEPEDSDSSKEIAGESLDRLAQAVGGQVLVPMLFEHLPKMLTNNEWQQRYAALIAISLVGEGCFKVLLPHLGSLLDLILPMFADSHPRVRYAACQCIGQMCTDFQPHLQTKFHARLVHALVGVMDDSSNPRVQAHGAAACINFCDDLDRDVVIPYLDLLLGKLAALLQENRRQVQEQALTAIAAIADCVGDAFLKYYDLFMPFLKSVLVNAKTKEYRTMRGKAIECMSLIGVAVGKEKFLADAREIMEELHRTQANQLEADDPQIGFMLQAWARICKCLGADFVPYLQVVMPPVLGSAKVQPDVQIQDAEAPAESGWEYIPFGDKNIAIKTSTLEEKSTACNMLFCYVTELGEGFFPYVEEVTKTLVPLLKFAYHEGVRNAASQSLCPLLRAAHQRATRTDGNMTFVLSLWNYMLPALLAALDDEDDREIECQMLYQLHECATLLGPQLLNPEHIRVICEAVKSRFRAFEERRAERAEEVNDDADIDQEQAEKVEEEIEREEEVLGEIAEVIGTGPKLLGASFTPYAQQMLDIPNALLQPTRRAHDRQIALCIIDDLVEFSQGSFNQYLTPYLAPMLASVGDSDPALRQAAAYGLGVCAQHASAVIAPLLNNALSALSVVIAHPESRNEDNIYATENAIAAYGKILRYCGDALDVNTLLPTWLSYLPVVEDKVEAQLTYAMLCDFVETRTQVMLGANFANVPKLLSVFVKIFRTLLVNDALNARIKHLCKSMQTGFPPAVVQQAFATLPPEDQQKLQAMLAEP